jgi:hypothetical protein
MNKFQMEVALFNCMENILLKWSIANNDDPRVNCSGRKARVS